MRHSNYIVLRVVRLNYCVEDMVCYLTTVWAFLSHLHKATSFEIGQGAFHRSVIISMEDYRYQIISNGGFYHLMVAWWLPNCCFAAGTGGVWPIISGGKCPPLQSYFASLSVLGKTLKLLWGQELIPVSSCRLSIKVNVKPIPCNIKSNFCCQTDSLSSVAPSHNFYPGI